MRKIVFIIAFILVFSGLVIACSRQSPLVGKWQDNRVIAEFFKDGKYTFTGPYTETGTWRDLGNKQMEVESRGISLAGSYEIKNGVLTLSFINGDKYILANSSEIEQRETNIEDDLKKPPDISKNTADHDLLTATEPDLDQLLDFVENSSDADLLNFLGNVGLYMGERDNEKHTYIYYQCFYLGEKSFFIEGEYFSNSSLITPVRIDSLDFRLVDYSISFSSSVVVWENTATEISGSKFHNIIDITKGKSNGEKRYKSNQSHNFIGPMVKFPIGFPGYILEFALNGNSYQKKLFMDEYNNDSGIPVPHYEYSYVYVEKPIDLSTTFTFGTDIGWDYRTGKNPNYYTHYLVNLHFTEPGWYKVIISTQEISTDPRFLSGKDSHIWPYTNNGHAKMSGANFALRLPFINDLIQTENKNE